jgi:hypothetical protein
MKSCHASFMIVTIPIWYPTTMRELTFCGLISVYPTAVLYGHTEHDFVLLLTHASFASFKNLETVQLYYVTANYIVNIQRLAEKMLPRILIKNGTFGGTSGMYT